MLTPLVTRRQLSTPAPHHSFRTSRIPSTMSAATLDAPAGVTRPIVFFDIMIGDTPAGRIKMGASVAPSRSLAPLGPRDSVLEYMPY